MRNVTMKCQFLFLSENLRNMYQVFLRTYLYINTHTHTHTNTCVSFLPGLISVARVNEQRITDLTRVFKAPSPELCQNAFGVVNKQKIFCFHQCSPEYSMNKFRSYIHRLVFRFSQDSSVWLGLTSREKLMSPECSKHQLLSFSKMLVVW